MPYDPHTISLEIDLSTLAEHPLGNAGEETVILGSVALVRSLECKTPAGPRDNATGLSRSARALIL